MQTNVAFHLPTVPYSAIDLCNRIAAATGSVGYAQRTACANYNGHTISVTFNTYRGYWIAEHYWGERVVWCRGSLADCLYTVKTYWLKGDKGAAVNVTYALANPKIERDRNPPESVMQFAAICAAYGFTAGSLYRYVAPGVQAKPTWWTPKHDAVADAMSMRKWFPGLDGIACNMPDDCTEADYKAAAHAYMQGLRPRAMASLAGG